MGMLQLYNQHGYKDKESAQRAADLSNNNPEFQSHACYGSLAACERAKYTVTYSGCPLDVVPMECINQYIKELQEMFPVTLSVFTESEMKEPQRFKSHLIYSRDKLPFVVVSSLIESADFIRIFGSDRCNTLRLVYHTFLRALHTYPDTLALAWAKYQNDSSKSLMDWYLYYACTDTNCYSDSSWKPAENQHGGHSFITADSNRKLFPVSARQFIFNFLASSRRDSINNTFNRSCVVPFNVKSLY